MWFDEMSGRRRFDAIELHAVHGGLNDVDDVVQLLGQVVDVLPVDGSYEGAVEAVDHLVGHPVAFVFDLANLGNDLAVERPMAHQFAEGLGALDHVFGRLFKDVEKPFIFWNETESHGRAPPLNEESETEPWW